MRMRAKPYADRRLKSSRSSLLAGIRVRRLGRTQQRLGGHVDARSPPEADAIFRLAELLIEIGRNGAVRAMAVQIEAATGTRRLSQVRGCEALFPGSELLLDEIGL